MASMECTAIGPDCPSDGSPLGYAPNMAASIIFMVLFSISLVGQIALGWKYKTWTFLIAMGLGSSSEVVGYLGRILMRSNPYNLNTFLVQIVCLTIGPAFYSAGLYLCLSRIVMVYGEKISRIRPVWYTRFFINCDIVSLSLQGAGGGIASAATEDSTMNLGNHLMLAGLIFQIVSLFIFALACGDFALRTRKFSSWRNPIYSNLRTSTKFRGFLWASILSFITIFTRCVYRVIELGGGWNNSLMRQETPFIILESCMIVIAVYAVTIFHPGLGFQNKFGEIFRADDGKEEISMSGAENAPYPHQQTVSIA